MINLEWIRTFRTVYKYKSLSRAAAELGISQPAVSQHVATLEAHVGSKLFDRKSKGVQETDAGKLFNTKIAPAIEELEKIEYEIVQNNSTLSETINFGISPHLYSHLLSKSITHLGPLVHVAFSDKKDLIREVEEGNLHYAIINEEVNTFDLNCLLLIKQKLHLTTTQAIDASEFLHLYKNDKRKCEEWLKKHIWFSHEKSSGFIKLFWLYTFDKKRPSIVPNYVIPNEHEMLKVQAGSEGLSIAFNSSVQSFTDKGLLKQIALEKCFKRNLYLIANKKKTTLKDTQKIISLLKDNISPIE